MNLEDQLFDHLFFEMQSYLFFLVLNAPNYSYVNHVNKFRGISRAENGTPKQTVLYS